MEVAQEYLKEIVEYREGYFIRKRKTARKQRIGEILCQERVGAFYHRMCVDSIRYYTHRLIWIWHNGAIPVNMEVDHINCDGQDNRIENLRLCSRLENARNRRKYAANSSSIYKGVYWDARAQRWVARVKVLGKHVHLGVYTQEYKAALAYNSYIKDLHGDFANLNIITIPINQRIAV
jgi:hypothetical protein